PGGIWPVTISSSSTRAMSSAFVLTVTLTSGILRPRPQEPVLDPTLARDAPLLVLFGHLGSEISRSWIQTNAKRSQDDNRRSRSDPRVGALRDRAPVLGRGHREAARERPGRAHARPPRRRPPARAAGGRTVRRSARRPDRHAGRADGARRPEGDLPLR